MDVADSAIFPLQDSTASIDELLEGVSPSLPYAPTAIAPSYDILPTAQRLAGAGSFSRSPHHDLAQQQDLLDHFNVYDGLEEDPPDPIFSYDTYDQSRHANPAFVASASPLRSMRVMPEENLFDQSLASMSGPGFQSQQDHTPDVLPEGDSCLTSPSPWRPGRRACVQ